VAAWGNLANRMLSFAYKRFDGVVTEPGELDAEDRALLARVEAGFETVGEPYGMARLKIDKAHLARDGQREGTAGYRCPVRGGRCARSDRRAASRQRPLPGRPYGQDGTIRCLDP